MTSIEVAREFLKNKDIADYIKQAMIKPMAAFADQISEQRVKAERTRLLKEIAQLGDKPMTPLALKVRLERWIRTEFAKEIGGTDGTDGD